MKLATLLPLRRLCELAQVSRAGFYLWRQAATPVVDDMELRDDIQRIALEFPYNSGAFQPVWELGLGHFLAGSP